MLLTEKIRKFPIKLFRNTTTNEVEYENAFTFGTTRSLNDAFKLFQASEFVDDLYKYYNDIVDVRFGSFVPSLSDKPRNNRIYLGKLELFVDVIKWEIEPEHTVAYLSKNKHEIPKHLKYINDMKRLETKDTLMHKIKRGIANIMNKLNSNKIHEMFQPIKATTDHICAHCGNIIPIATYYDTYRSEDYHIECIWDHLVNNMTQNSYLEAEKFFFSLEQNIGNWPGYGFDVEQDYIDDLELVKHNNRILKREPFSESIKYINKSFNYYEKNL